MDEKQVNIICLRIIRKVLYSLLGELDLIKKLNKDSLEEAISECMLETTTSLGCLGYLEEDYK